MKINYVKHYSHALGRDMEYKTYGQTGHPVLVFPSQDGRFYDYQDFDMVGVLSGYIDRGLIRLICVDSIDRETWSDIQTYSSICRMRQSSKADSYRCFERFKRFRVQFDV